MSARGSAERCVWRYWLPDRGETADDWRPWRDHPWRDPDFVAADIAERKWHEDGPDFFEQEIVAIVSPLGEEHVYDVYVECVPSFRARRRS